MYPQPYIIMKKDLNFPGLPQLYVYMQYSKKRIKKNKSKTRINQEKINALKNRHHSLNKFAIFMIVDYYYSQKVENIFIQFG